MAYYEGQDLEHLDESSWRKCALAQLQTKQKPIAKLWGLATTLQEIDADVVMLVEVGGQESLENFNRYFLSDRYTPYFVEGNSRRGIDLGFLVKKAFPFSITVKSNRETPVEVHTLHGVLESKFSRDIAELRVSDESGIRLILMLVHLKSKITSDADYQGKDVRTGEAMALAQFYQSRRQEFIGTPIILAGDFNAHLDSLDLEMLRHTDLLDLHDVLQTAPEDRTSLMFFDFDGTPRPQVLDYILLSPDLRQAVVPSGSGVYRYRWAYGIAEPLAGSQMERNRQPSDHYPVVVQLQL